MSMVKGLGGPVVVLILIGALVSGCVSTSSGGTSDKPNSITVSGEGKAYGKPDVAYITLGVETTGDTAKAAMDQNARMMTQVVEKVKAAGVVEKDIQTSSLQLTPVYATQNKTDPSQPPKIVGYRAANRVTVTINDLSRASDVVDGVTAVGANAASGLRFGIKDDSKLRQQALADAAKQCQDKAKVIADALGIKLQGVLSIQEEYSSAPQGAGDVRAMAAQDSTPVLAGEMSIIARVQAVYKIQ